MVRTRKKLTDTQQQFIKTGTVNGSLLSPSSHLPYVLIPLDKLEAWKEQPRHYFSQSSLEHLAKTLKEEGIKHPLLVRPKQGHAERYEVIAGERRFQAAKLASFDTLPVLIKDLNDQQALEAALSENLNREELNPVEVLDSLLNLLSTKLQQDEAQVCSLLRRMKYQWEKLDPKPQDINIPNPDDEQQKLMQQTFEQYGYTWYSFTSNYLKLKDLPQDLYETIAEGKIEYSKGLLFHSIKDEALRNSLLEQALAQGWTQAEIQQRIREKPSQLNREKEPNSPTPQQQLKALTFRIKKVKPWKEHPKVWKKIERNLTNIERYLHELESQTELSEDSIFDGN